MSAPDWRQRGACRDVDPEVFFRQRVVGRPRKDGAPVARQWNDADAKSVCRRCPVRMACLSWALDTGQDDGVWGGLNPDERARFTGRGAS